MDFQGLSSTLKKNQRKIREDSKKSAVLPTSLMWFLASQDAQEVMLVTEWVSYWSLADLTDVTLVSEDATHNSLQMSSSRDLTDVSEARDLTGVSEIAAHNYLQMSSSRDLTDVQMKVDDADDDYAADSFDESWWWW